MKCGHRVKERVRKEARVAATPRRRRRFVTNISGRGGARRRRGRRRIELAPGCHPQQRVDVAAGMRLEQLLDGCRIGSVDERDCGGSTSRIGSAAGGSAGIASVAGSSVLDNAAAVGSAAEHSTEVGSAMVGSAAVRPSARGAVMFGSATAGSGCCAVAAAMTPSACSLVLCCSLVRAMAAHFFALFRSGLSSGCGAPCPHSIQCAQAEVFVGSGELAAAVAAVDAELRDALVHLAPRAARVELLTALVQHVQVEHGAADVQLGRLGHQRHCRKGSGRGVWYDGQYDRQHGRRGEPQRSRPHQSWQAV